MTTTRSRLRRDLQQIADHATVTDSGWTGIRSRIENETGDPQKETVVDIANGTADRRRRWTTGAVLAAAAAVLVAVIVGSADRLDDDGAIATGPQPEHIATAQRGSEAEAVVVEYIDAFNVGDVDRAVALFAYDARLRARNQSIGNSGGNPTLGQWESVLAWYAGQGARISDVGCETIDATTGRASLRCEWRVDDAITEIANRPGDRIQIEMTVEGGRIVEFDRADEWTQDHVSFTVWLMTNHPEEGLLSQFLGSWPYGLSADPSRELGERFVVLARAWAEQSSEAGADQPAGS
jgi:hypothetical protein